MPVRRTEVQYQIGCDIGRNVHRCQLPGRQRRRRAHRQGFTTPDNLAEACSQALENLAHRTRRATGELLAATTRFVNGTTV